MTAYVVMYVSTLWQGVMDTIGRQYEPNHDFHYYTKYLQKIIKKKNITKRKINIHTQINTKRKLIGFKPYNDVLSANVAALKRYQGT